MKNYHHILFCCCKFVADDEPLWNHSEFCSENIFLLLQHCGKTKTMRFCCSVGSNKKYFPKLSWPLALFSCACNNTYGTTSARKMLEVAPDVTLVLKNKNFLPIFFKNIEKLMQNQTNKIKIKLHIKYFLSLSLCGDRKGFNSHHTLISLKER